MVPPPLLFGEAPPMLATGCALGYLDFRFAHIDWRSEHPNLKRLADKLALRQSFIDSAPPTS